MINPYEWPVVKISDVSVLLKSGLSRKLSDDDIGLPVIRSGKSHDYDIVIGAMADDQIYNYISDYMDGTITREQFWVLAKFKYPTHQIVFCSNEALKCLRYRGYEEAQE